MIFLIFRDFLKRGEKMNMIYGEIDALRTELNNLILRDAAYEEIYKLSIQLDKLIVLYYNHEVSDIIN